MDHRPKSGGRVRPPSASLANSSSYGISPGMTAAQQELARKLAALEIPVDHKKKARETFDENIVQGMYRESESIERELHRQAGDDMYTAAPKLERTLKRNAAKEETARLLKRLESRAMVSGIGNMTERGERGGVGVGADRSNSMVGGHISVASEDKRTTTRKMIDESKVRARENFLSHLRAMTVEDVKIEAQKEIERVTNEYRAQLDQVMVERDRYMSDARRAESEVRELQEDAASKEYTHELLQQKLQRTLSRDAENQKKLKVFSSLEPIFTTLVEKFNFSSPTDVLERLESLERAQTDSYTQLLEAQETRAQLERRIEQMEKEQESKIATRLLDLSTALDKSEKKRRELQQTMDEMQAALKRAEDYQKKYLTVNFAIVDLFNQWETILFEAEEREEEWRRYQEAKKAASSKSHRSSSMINPDDGDSPDAQDQQQQQQQQKPKQTTASALSSGVDMSDPLQVVNALRNMTIAVEPSRAAKAFRDLSGLANTFWLRYFGDNIDIKGKAREVFERVGLLVDDRLEEINRLKKQLGEMRKEDMIVKGELAKVHNEKRNLQATIDRYKDSIAAATSRSASAAAGAVQQEASSSSNHPSMLFHKTRPSSAISTSSSRRPVSASAVRRAPSFNMNSAASPSLNGRPATFMTADD